MSKRSNGEGSVFKSKKTGKWVAQVTYYEDGIRRRKTRSSVSKSEAKTNLGKLLEEVKKGLAGSGSDTLTGYMKAWLVEVEMKHTSNTFHTYRRIIEVHILPVLGLKKINDIRPADVQDMINKLTKKGAGKRTVQMAYNVLNQAMRRAYKFRMILENPCGPVEKPRHKPAKARPFTVDEVQALLKHLDGHHLYSICYTALTTGMRPGELFGLFWEHVDLESCEIHIQQQLAFTAGIKELKDPKTESSIRTIAISEKTAAVLADQRKHLVKSGYASSKFVFCGKRGIPYGSSNFSKLWKDVLKDAGLPHRGFHQMRHTFATLAIGSGTNVAVVSETLGHTSTAMTLDIYTHVLPSMKSDATDAVTKIIG